MKSKISFTRIRAIVFKEFIQIRRDKLTLGMMLGIPIIQLILFGFAINSNPKHLPTAVINGDGYNQFTTTFISSLENSEYFDVRKEISSEKKAKELMLSNKASFVITIPPGFYNKMLRGEKPQILLDADSVNSQSVGTGISVAQEIFNRVNNNIATGPLSYLKSKAQASRLIVHHDFNPDQIMQFTTVPGLIGVILTLTLVFITSLSMTKEVERGTMENLLCLPVKPIEVLLGKMGPYVVMGFIQLIITLVAAKYIFGIPVNGNPVLLLFLGLLFIIVCLAVGIVFSTIARNQLQAVQMSMFFFLPSILLSGFMFPFQAMPEWAQFIGNCLPLTHFNVIAWGIMVKGSSLYDLHTSVYAILVFLAVVLGVGVLRYRRTLD